VQFFSKLGTKRTEFELEKWFEKWFEQLREHGKEMGVEVEPLTVCERICLEHDVRWMALS